MQLPRNVASNKRARSTLKFKVTPKCVWPKVEDELLEGTDETRMLSTVKPSMDSDRRMLEMSIDGQRCKRQKNSCEEKRQRNRVSVAVTKKLEANVSDMSIDDQRWKKQKMMDCNVKAECSKLLKELMDRRLAWAFTKPVDLVKAPDYFKKIKNPMDLGTIKRNLERNMYSDANEFADDMLLTFGNAMLYHSPSDDVYRNARLLNCNFKRSWEILAKKLKLVVEKSHQVMKPAAAAGLMKAPKGEKRGKSRRESLEKRLKLGPRIKNYEKTRIEEQLKAAEMASRKRERNAARMALEKIKKTVEIDTPPMLLREMRILFGCYSNPKALEKIGFYLKQNYVEEYEV